MTVRKSIVSGAGVAFALAWPVLNWRPVLERVPVPDTLPQLSTAIVLAALAFVINKRPAGFFHFRPVGWSDIRAALLALFVIFMLVALAQPVVEHFQDAGTASPSEGAAETSLWLGLLTSVTAGISEEFIYRGFVIEELGQLIRSRPAATAVSVVSFGLAHQLNYGWSLELIYPGLVGLVITILYLKRLNLPLCMLLHVAIDSLSALSHAHSW